MRATSSVVAILALCLAPAVLAQGLPPEPEALGPLTAWAPPLPCEGMFTDVPCGSQFDIWIEQLARDGITSGCAAGQYCPTSPVTRKQMAVFVERAMRGATGWPPNTVLVFPVKDTAGNPLHPESGTELLARVASIPTTGPDVPTDANPWRVLVAPGTYNLGSATLTLPSNVTLQGSGRGATKITSNTGGATATPVIAAMGGTVRDLSIMTYGPGATVVALAMSGGIVRVRDVEVYASNGTTRTIGVLSDGAAPLTLDAVEVSVHGASPYGIRLLNGASAVVRGGSVTYTTGGAELGHGVYVDGSTVTIDGLTVHHESSGTSRGYGLDVVNGSTCNAARSVFEGDARGTLDSYGAYVSNGSTLTSDGSTYTSVDRAGTGATARGFYASNSTVDITGGRISGTHYGIYLSAASAAHTCTIRNAVLSGGSSSLTNGANWTTTVVSTDLETTNSAGTLRCIAVYDTVSGAFWPTTCP